MLTSDPSPLNSNGNSCALTFTPFDLIHRGKGYTFDDVLLVPRMSELRSRRDPDLSTQLTKQIHLQIPLISANMDTVTESDMAIAMAELGGLGILHRFMPIADQVVEVKKIKNKIPQAVVAASIGTNGDWKERAHALVDAGVKCLTIDIAHGHSVMMIDAIQWVKSTFPQVEVIAGNVATAQAVRDLAKAGADAIKVGIGPGSMCTTRIITGCGVPQLTAIAVCALAAKELGIPIIADGGLKHSGDIVKALACGASAVMMGSMLAGTLETPGEIHHGMKKYRGMASKHAQVSWRGELPKGMAPEGESTTLPVKGPVSHVVDEICGGIRSGMSYLNSQKITDLISQSEFIEMTSNGIRESVAHGLR